MGLDQRLEWFGKPSKDQVKRLHHKNIWETNYSMCDVDEEGYNSKRFEHIKKYCVPEEVYVKYTDWDMIKKECGVPLDSNICLISGREIGFGKSVNSEDINIFQVCCYDKKYEKKKLEIRYFYLNDEVYRWRNNYDIQELFNNTFPEEWCDYKEKYEMVYAGHYKLTNTLLNKMKKIDSIFAMEYDGELNNIYYSADW